MNIDDVLQPKEQKPDAAIFTVSNCHFCGNGSFANPTVVEVLLEKLIAVLISFITPATYRA